MVLEAGEAALPRGVAVFEAGEAVFHARSSGLRGS
jgi:hypothetical protein